MRNDKQRMINWREPKMMTQCMRIVPLAAVVNLVVLATAFAEDLSARRDRARSEVERLFFDKQVSIQAQLVSAEGPEWWEKTFGKKVFGCPALPSTGQPEELSIAFSTGGAGAWAGDLDGINTDIRKPTGAIGSGLVVPSKSTARLPESQSGPEFEFLFDGTSDVKRALVDAAAEKIDRCVSNLPVGNYLGDDLSRLCPAPEVSRGEQNQTCVPYVRGVIGEKLADGSGYKVSVTQQTMCDFVGYGRSGKSNTSFTPCSFNYYEGVAQVVGEKSSARLRSLKAVSRKALRDCGRNGRKLDSRKIARCVEKSMAKSRTR